MLYTSADGRMGWTIMLTDYKTTITYFIVVAGFIYSVYVRDVALVSIIIFPLIAMWAILKTNSKELAKMLVEAIKTKWSK